MKHYCNILVINVNWIGDVIFSSAVFQALEDAYPSAKISCLAVPRVKEILESVPSIDEIIVYEEDGRHKMPWGKLQLIAQLRRKKFDCVFILHRSLTRALLTFFAGIPVRVGYNTKGRDLYLTHKIQESSDSLHRQDYYLHLLEAFGISIRERQSFLEVDLASQQRVQQLLRSFGIESSDSFVVVNPGGNWDLKRWPQGNFTQLIDQILQEFQMKVILTGSQNDTALAQKIIFSLKRKPVDLTGKVNLKELIALMKMAGLVISADSGPLHIASSVGTKTIGLFGPTSPDITGPRGKGLSQILRFDVGCNRMPCYYLDCPQNICMHAISVQDVLEKVRVLRETR